MKKFIVETYYTCTFKTVHTLDDLNDHELSKIDARKDGDVEVIDVKLNNRKTKKIGDWFMWMHHTVNKIPINNEKKYLWQKTHAENQTGSMYSYKPIKISKNNKIKKYETWK